MNSKSIQEIRISFFATILAAAPFTQTLHAQENGLRVKVDVPFAFDSGSKHFAAGEYIITQPTQGVILINSENRKSGNATAFVAWQQDFKPVTRGKVVFRRYGDQYFLRGVFVQGTQSHLECAPSKAEKMAQQHLNRASAETSMDRVELALLSKQ